MRKVTVAQMQALDKKTIEAYGIPGLVLMENAGRGIAEFIFQSQKGRRAIIVCGKGNNGGDGFVIARHLWNKGFALTVFSLGDEADLTSDAKVNYVICKKMNIPVQDLKSEADLEKMRALSQRTDMIIDAIFGVGLGRDVDGFYKEVVEGINHLKNVKIAVDIPSGLHGDSGKALSCAVRADYTATLGLPKIGLFEGDGPAYAGRICVIDIGIPKELLRG